MKIVCDSCGAKYSISDDKVQGKVFKIRCKKCQHIIVVRGGAQTEAPPVENDTRVYGYGDDGGGAGGDDAVWHVVVDQDQVGPMTMAEVEQRLRAGQIDAETYVWREGFADWIPMSQADEFANLLAGVAAGGGAAAVASVFGGAAVSLGGMEVPAAREHREHDVFLSGPAPAVEADEHDLFDRRSAPMSAAMMQPPAEIESSKLRGQRNENSVLFSLGNLAQLASDSPKPAAAAIQSNTGRAQGEGSGLIDIRSMASAYVGDRGGKAGSAGIGSIDDIPVFSTASFSEPAVLMPMGGSRSGVNPKLLYGLIGVVGVLAVVAVILVVKLMGREPPVVAAKTDEPAAKPTDATAAEVAKPDDAKPATPDAPAAGQTEPPAKPETTVASAPEKPEKGDSSRSDKSSSRRDDKKKPRDEKPERASSSSSSSSSSAPEPKPSGGGGCDEVSCVLSNYEGSCCQKFKRGGGSSAGSTSSSSSSSSKASNLPESLDKGIISAGVAKVAGKAQACGGRSSAKGTVKVSVKVSPDGSVSSVSVKQAPDPELGDCVANAMQRASFAKTQNGGSFSYPFTF